MTRNPNEAQFDKYRNWQWIKHLALADYIVPWAEKVGSIAHSIFIVDLFAGKGTYQDALTGETTDGSPPIFARRAQRYLEKHPDRTMQVICSERNKKNVVALTERVGGFGSLVKILHGSFARHIDNICSTIGNAPALILFDPIGLKPIAATTIRPLLHRRGKTDVFMILHFKVIHRTAGMLLDTGYADPSIASAARSAAMLDAVFGTKRWRFIAKNPRITSVEERERAYLELYFEEVLGSRYPFRCAYAVRSKYISKVQYWLVHASDHLDAHLLMNDEIMKLEAKLYELTYRAEEALPGFIEQEWEKKVAAEEALLAERMFALLMKAPDCSMTFGELRDTLLPEFFGSVKQGAYSRAAKALMRAERITREKDGLRPKIELSERLSIPAAARAAAASAA